MHVGVERRLARCVSESGLDNLHVGTVSLGTERPALRKALVNEPRSLGQFAGNTVFGGELKAATQQIARMTNRVEHMSNRIDKLDGKIEHGVERGAHRGTREGNKDRRHQARVAADYAGAP